MQLLPQTEPEAVRSHGPDDLHDVLIMGGGLAGLTLALQLRDRMPDLDIRVLERRRHPVPAAAHKVGESTVEIGAHYLADTLGLREHLETAQLKKFGFRFFFSEGQRDIENVFEIGASRPLATGSFQIDRGLFENFLAEEAQRRGVRFDDAARVLKLELSTAGALHEVRWMRDGEESPRTIRARWVIDACGRAGLIKRQRGLAKANDHAAHAVWFRVGTRIEIDRWSDDPAWRARTQTPTRWLSTNHLVGAGYWVWLIPLASGSHSVGIVADPAFHALDRMDTFDKAMQWLHQFQPRLADALEPERDKLQDFAYLRRFSYDCTQVFSAERWALAGEAGRFLDPFYSPGSDFIAIGNTYTTELIARDRAGKPLAAHVQVYEQIFRSFYDSTLSLYQDQYGLFGDPDVLPHKIIWDYSYYWGVLAQLFFQGRLADMASLSVLREGLQQAQALNLEVQALLRRWGQANAAAAATSTPDHPRHNPRRMLDQAALPWFAELNRSLQDQLDTAAFRERIKAEVQRLQRLAIELADQARIAHPDLDLGGLPALLQTAAAMAPSPEALLPA